MDPAQGFRMPSENAARESNRGDHILKPGMGMIKRPSWAKSDPTVLRVLPCIQDGNFQPTRYNNTDFSGWFYAASMVLGFGNPQKSWIAYDPEDTHYDTRNNPAVILYDLASQVSVGKIKGPQEWALMIKGGQGRSALISRPDMALMVRCAIYENKGASNNPPDGLAPNHQTVFMLLKKSAWSSMNKEINTPSGVTSEDPNLRFQHGDIVSLTDGAYMLFYEMGFTPRGYEHLKAISPMAYTGKSKPIGYDCLLSKTYRGQPATFSNEEIAMIAKRVETPIKDCVSVPSDEEQVRFIVDSMRDNAASAGLVVHALRDRYERIMPADFVGFGNEFLRQVGLMATLVSNPGFNQPTAQAQAQWAPNQTPLAYQQATSNLAPVGVPVPQPVYDYYPKVSAPAIPHPVSVPNTVPMVNNMADIQRMVSSNISESSENSEKIQDILKAKLSKARSTNGASE